MTARLASVTNEPLHCRADGERFVVYAPHIMVSMSADEAYQFLREGLVAMQAIRAAQQASLPADHTVFSGPVSA